MCCGIASAPCIGINTYKNVSKIALFTPVMNPTKSPASNAATAVCMVAGYVVPKYFTAAVAAAWYAPISIAAYSIRLAVICRSSGAGTAHIP